MRDLSSARCQRGLSLAFHMIFAVTGVSLPLMMTIAEWLWIRTREPVYQVLAKRWAKGAAILLAVGAVSGTMLSFELGLLWPRFMERVGSLVGKPLFLEAFAFFTEAIFLGIYLYGWYRLPAVIHLLSGAIVAVSGAVSAWFVTFVNAWMNTPSAITFVNREFAKVEPLEAILNPAAIGKMSTAQPWINYMKHIEIIMKSNSLSFKPMSPCLRLFIENLLDEQGIDITIEELILADDAIVGSAAFASGAPLAANKRLQLRRL